jgi:recombination DNA repair RAD52 pathway protein
MKNAIDSGKKLGDKFKSGYQKGIDGFTKEKTESGYVKDEKTGKWVKNAAADKLPLAMPEMPAMPDSPTPDIDELLKKLNQDKKKDSSKKKKDDTLSLGVPQNYNQTNAYSVITAKFPSAPVAQADNKAANPTEKPVVNMATRVEEIAGSLRKIAAAAAVPVMMTFATPASAGSVAEGNSLFNTVTQTAETYDNSTSSLTADNSTHTERTDNSKNYTTNNQGKTVRFDRFTDKIEIHVSGGDPTTGAAIGERIREEVEKALAEILNV